MMKTCISAVDLKWPSVTWATYIADIRHHCMPVTCLSNGNFSLQEFMVMLFDDDNHIPYYLAHHSLTTTENKGERTTP